MTTSKSAFKGGYYFRRFKGEPRAEIIDMGVPEQVILPLRQGYGQTVVPTVSVGDKVKAGQIIGQNDDEIATPVQATVNGTVKEIREMNYRGVNVPVVIITAEGDQENHHVLAEADEQFEKLSPETISKLLYQSGVSALGNCGIPTFERSSSLQPDQVKYLIISALETTPFALPGKILCQNQPQALADGIKILRRLFAVPVYIGVSKVEKQFRAELQQALAQEENVKIVALKPKYPQESPEILTETLLGQPLPDDKFPDAIGVVVLDASAVIAAHQAVTAGKPLISRVVSLGGTGYPNNMALRVRIGTPIQEILAKWAQGDVEKRPLLGNALLGDIANDPLTPVGREVSSLVCLEEERRRRFLFFLRPGLTSDSNSRSFAANLLPLPKHLDTNEHGEHRPCIQCSYCEDVCPRPLYPYLLSKYCTHEMAEEALGLRLLACIECGLCSYVCPSKIPLMTHIQQGKHQLRQEGLIK